MERDFRKAAAVDWHFHWQPLNILSLPSGGKSLDYVVISYQGQERPPLPMYRGNVLSAGSTSVEAGQVLPPKTRSHL